MDVHTETDHSATNPSIGTAPITLPLAVLAGLPVLLLTFSRRRAINFCTGLWADMCCTLIGIHVEVSGEESLQSPRPAVFVLNYQSSADGFLVAKLIRRDIAFMDKSELSRQPVRVDVLPAIEASQWTKKSIDDRIEA